MPTVSIKVKTLVTSNVPLDSSFKSTAKVTAPLVPPPLSPTPAVTLSMSPASFVKLNCPVELL